MVEMRKLLPHQNTNFYITQNINDRKCESPGEKQTAPHETSVFSFVDAVVAIVK